MELRTTRTEEAERLRPYFAVQLLFAERLAEVSGSMFAHAVLKYTNLHRRFGLGRADPERPGAKWLRFVFQLDELRDEQARLDWTVEFYAGTEPPDGEGPRFGCFSFDPPEPDGVVRIHFSNQDTDGVSPLARAKIERRRTELARMCRHISLHHPDAEVIRGGSWMYNLNAYCRLFPPAYVASRRPQAQVRLDGTSTWGQLLTHRGDVKAETRDRIVGNLARLDSAAPWRAFPLRALAVEAPLSVFQDHFDGALPAGELGSSG